METRKLYYDDCHLKEFSATVLSCQSAPEGWHVVLDATAFYPEGGGQACDTGTLGGAEVTAVMEAGEEILHLCTAPLEPGTTVTGNIHWDRRFDLMQQHTGEHMVSGIVTSRYNCHNVGFHVGADAIQIDFDAIIPPEDLPEIELAVNRAIWENLPVACFVPSETELPGVFYRSKRPLPWPVRIVRIEGVDSCACCGVHTARTGEVGLVKLLSCVKFHQGVRLELVCGSRAYDYVSRVCAQNREVSRLLSAKPFETGEAAQRLCRQLSDEKFRAAGLQKQVFAAIAQGYSGQGHVLHFSHELAPAQLRELAEQIANRCSGIAAVCAGKDGKYSICLARPGGSVDALGQGLRNLLGARGGGKDGFFQGSVETTEAQLREFFKTQWNDS